MVFLLKPPMIKELIKSIQRYIFKKRLCKKIRKGKIDVKLLQEVDLSYTNLSNIDMRGAKLHFSVLIKTNLKNTILQGAVVKHAYLQGADLSGANLIFANFTGADLRGANLSNTTLYNADFTGADLTNANLNDIKIDRTTNFTGAKMINVTVDVERLKLAKIDGADIQPTNAVYLVLRRLSSISYTKKKIMPINC
jgi:uncharacterized protein YjbI with pentapeptide repeats